MHDFTYDDGGRLCCAEVPLERIAREVGTPVYCYSLPTLRRHIQAFEEPLAGIDHQTCFAMKANSNMAILTLMGRHGLGADVVSGGELFRALKAGIPASKIVYSGVGKRADEIEYALFELGAEDFAFTDDALLLDAPHHFEKIADEFLRRGLQARFHTPNSVFSSAISPSVAEKMRAMNFQTIRLSLETTNAERLRAMNRKMFPPHFETAMKNLRAAGFGRKEIGAYIMAGMPGQDADETLEAIEFAKACGARPHLAEYSPIPGTRAFFEAAAISRLDIRSEPLLHNNSIFYLLGGAIDMAAMEELKRVCAMND